MEHSELPRADVNPNAEVQWTEVVPGDSTEFIIDVFDGSEFVDHRVPLSEPFGKVFKYSAKNKHIYARGSQRSGVWVYTVYTS